MSDRGELPIALLRPFPFPFFLSYFGRVPFPVNGSQCIISHLSPFLHVPCAKYLHITGWLYLHLLSLESLSAHFLVFIHTLQFFVVPFGDHDPPLLDRVPLLEDDELGDRKPAELGDLDFDAGLEKDCPFVLVTLRACPLGELGLCGDLPLGDVEERAYRPGDGLRLNLPCSERPLGGARPVRDPSLLTDMLLESLER